jgi:hypothetical protein
VAVAVAPECEVPVAAAGAVPALRVVHTVTRSEQIHDKRLRDRPIQVAEVEVRLMGVPVVAAMAEVVL